jgi:hypothetical protein
MRRRFQFSLAALLVTTAVVALVVNWWTLRQRAIAARQRFDEATSDYDAGVGTWVGITTASKELLQAELAVPLVPSDRVVWLSYLDRTRHLYEKSRAMLNLGLFGADGGKRVLAEAQELLKECRDIEDRLGLPHIDDGISSPKVRDDLVEDDQTGDNLTVDELAPLLPDDFVRPPTDDTPDL